MITHITIHNLLKAIIFKLSYFSRHERKNLIKDNKNDLYFHNENSK